MRRHLALALVTAAALAACAAAPQPLNSERIAASFGNYGLEILAYRDGVRYASLYSTNDGTRICRTYAVTQFNAAAADSVEFEHARILAGESIGAMFKANGWRVSKYAHHISEIAAPPGGHPITALMRLGDARPLARHVYRIGLHKHAQSLEYATIIEVHHPDYLGIDDLREFYGGETRQTPSEQELFEWHDLLIEQRLGQ